MTDTPPAPDREAARIERRNDMVPAINRGGNYWFWRDSENRWATSQRGLGIACRSCACYGRTYTLAADGFCPYCGYNDAGERRAVPVASPAAPEGKRADLAVDQHRTLSRRHWHPQLGPCVCLFCRTKADVDRRQPDAPANRRVRPYDGSGGLMQRQCGPKGGNHLANVDATGYGTPLGRRSGDAYPVPSGWQCSHCSGRDCTGECEAEAWVEELRHRLVAAALPGGKFISLRANHDSKLYFSVYIDGIVAKLSSEGAR